jgi:hypothetical protein
MQEKADFIKGNWNHEIIFGKNNDDNKMVPKRTTILLDKKCNQ